MPSPHAAVSPLRTTRTFSRRLGRRVVAFLLGSPLRRIDAQLCAPGDLPRTGIHRIVILRPNHRLGNAVLLSPLLAEIETRYAGAEVDLVSAGEAAQSLFGRRFQVHRVLCLDRHIARHLLRTLLCLRTLRTSYYDLAINPCAASQSAHLLLGLCNASFKVGFSHGACADALKLPDHMALRAVAILRRARGDSNNIAWPPLTVHLQATELAQAHHALQRILGTVGPRQSILGLFANATGSKCLPEAWWRQLVAMLEQACPGLRIVNIMAAHGRTQLPAATLPFYTRDVRKLAAMLACLDGFVSADCGVMHLAAAVGTPTLGLFVHDNRTKYTPYGSDNSGLDVSVPTDKAEGVVSPNTKLTRTVDTELTHAAIIAWVQQCRGHSIHARGAHKPGDTAASCVEW